VVELQGTNKTRQTIGVEIQSPLDVSAVQLAILQCVATDQNCLTAHDWAAAAYACSWKVFSKLYHCPALHVNAQIMLRSNDFSLDSNTWGPGLEFRFRSVIRLFNVLFYALRLGPGIEGPEVYLVSDLSLLPPSLTVGSCVLTWENARTNSSTEQSPSWQGNNYSTR
jgi:hypothetical protein